MRLNTDGNWKLMLLALVRIAESLIVLCSFGIINPTWSADVIFSDWWMKD